MIWGYDDGWSWLLMAVTVLLFWAGAAVLMVVAMSAVNARGGDQTAGVRHDWLADGEITPEELERPRRALRRS